MAAKNGGVVKKTVSKRTAAKKAAAKRGNAKKAAVKQAVAKKVTKSVAAMQPATSATMKTAPARKAVKTTAAKKAERGAPVLLGVGDPMPMFSLPDHDGREVSSASLAGKRYVLYFYPKDDTPGCTTEACGFRDDQAQFAAAGVRVIGVSPDKPAAHQKFRAKYDLPFTLLCDPDHTLSQALGVWALKNNYGREYMGIVRSTFLVGEDGIILREWRNVRVAGHVPAVLLAIA